MSSVLMLLLLGLPFGAAGQNVAAGLSLLLLLIAKYKNQSSEQRVSPYSPLGLWHFILGSGFVLWSVVSTALNPLMSVTAEKIMELIFGYLPWIILPILTLGISKPLSQKEERRLSVLFAIICLCFGTIAISQNLIGWRLDGLSIVSAPLRARGFYSHPLTFAYVMLILFPLAAARIFQAPRDWISWAIFLGVSSGIYASQSRTVQVLCIAVIVYNIFLRARKAARMIAILGLVGGLLVMALTDNPMRQKLSETITTGHDVRSGYPDDRLAFWHVHWLMFEERPILGHGEFQDATYRAPYYDKIGLSGFERQYEAHNMFLQVLVSSGLFGFIFFLAIFSLWILKTKKVCPVVAETLVIFCMGGLTQNAFQDYEVRYALILCLSACALMLNFRLEKVAAPTTGALA